MFQSIMGKNNPGVYKVIHGTLSPEKGPGHLTRPRRSNKTVAVVNNGFRCHREGENQRWELFSGPMVRYRKDTVTTGARANYCGANVKAGT